ncbi:MAG: isoprenylcysteine carboxylmethyltransferase family protein [Candidatus Sulfotelmatobacter sp.]
MEDRSFYAITIAQIVAAGVVVWLVFLRPGAWDWQRSVGSALMFAGMAGIALARYQLGRSFAIRPQARQLVTHGIYSKIRNPIYVFGSLLFAGFVLVLHRPGLWLLFAAIVVMQTIRAHREAQVLEAAFGEAYREYRRKTWF